jgi:hypothetical protein
MEEVLAKAGGDLRHLAKATYYVTGPDAVKKMGELRPRYYDPKRPPAASLAVVQGTGRLNKTVAMDMIAIPSPRLHVNEYGPPERGHGLRDDKLKAGWIALHEDKPGYHQPKAPVPLFKENELSGWKAINHPTLPKERWPAWTIKDGVLTASGGPGCLEYQDKQFGDFVLQLEVRTRLRHANGGVFFRAMPGSLMNGYEAQIYNRCHDGDPARPWTWATGAIDDRHNTRRLVSRDGEWFHYTILAQGDRIRTWVNGYPTADFRDERKEHDNPRLGKRTKPGTIQLQAHDGGTEIEEIEFRNIRIGQWE